MDLTRERTMVAGAKRLACVAALAASSGSAAPPPHEAFAGPPPPQFTRATLGHFPAAAEVRRVADWVLRTQDHDGAPFLIIDKVRAMALLFDSTGRVRAVAPVLLGVAKGDMFPPGSAWKDMYDTRVEERITPAGRFTAEPGADNKGKRVLWLDYEAGIALHAVLDNPGERRPQRLASPSPDDNRISYGCINVPTDFYETVVRPAFEQRNGIVYVLPETRPAMPFFAAQDGKLEPARPKKSRTVNHGPGAATSGSLQEIVERNRLPSNTAASCRRVGMTARIDVSCR